MRICELVAPDTILRMPIEELGYCLLRVAHDHLREHRMVTQMTATSLDSPHGQPERVPFQRRRELQPVLDEAFHWLERQGLLVPADGNNGRNGYRVFGRGAAELIERRNFDSYIKAQAFPEALLHPTIASPVWMALARGDLDNAVLQAFRAVEEAVRAAGGYTNRDYGVNLMRAAFNPQGGPLTNMNDQPAEREGLRDLFVGAIASYKNPHSHRTVGLTELSDAQEQVMLASHLLRIVDARRPQRP